MSVMSVLLWTFVLFSMILYLFAAAGVELIGHDDYWADVELVKDPKVVEMVAKKFGDTPKNMLTLMRDPW